MSIPEGMARTTQPPHIKRSAVVTMGCVYLDADRSAFLTSVRAREDAPFDGTGHRAACSLRDANAVLMSGGPAVPFSFTLLGVFGVVRPPGQTPTCDAAGAPSADALVKAKLFDWLRLAALSASHLRQQRLTTAKARAELNVCRPSSRSIDRKYQATAGTGKLYRHRVSPHSVSALAPVARMRGHFVFNCTR